MTAETFHTILIFSLRKALQQVPAHSQDLNLLSNSQSKHIQNFLGDNWPDEKFISCTEPILKNFSFTLDDGDVSEERTHSSATRYHLNS